MAKWNENSQSEKTVWIKMPVCHKHQVLYEVCPHVKPQMRLNSPFMNYKLITCLCPIVHHASLNSMAVVSHLWACEWVMPRVGLSVCGQMCCCWLFSTSRNSRSAYKPKEDQGSQIRSRCNSFPLLLSFPLTHFEHELLSLCKWMEYSGWFRSRETTDLTIVSNVWFSSVFL